MGKFVVASREYLDTLISRRDGEVKLGERVQTIESEDWETVLRNSTAKFVLLGIPEDIGVRANYGVGGAHTTWEPALKALLNVQHTNLLNGEKLLVAGWFDFTKVMQRAEKADVSHLRDLVGYIDETVHPLITQIVAAGKVPIVIGGGHNNAYPLLKGASMVNDKPLNCINLDAHSDFRQLEGRHSGNGFRYAHREGYLKKYEVVGLHENYNAQDIVDELKDDPELHFTFYEDIFIRETLSFTEAVKNAIARISGKPCGVEIDLDCIERVLSSAATPTGISSLLARRYVSMCAQALSPVYLHITEGVVTLADGRQDTLTAKLITYLVTDFMKAYGQKRGLFN